MPGLALKLYWFGEPAAVAGCLEADVLAEALVGAVLASPSSAALSGGSITGSRRKTDSAFAVSSGRISTSVRRCNDG